MNLDAKREGVYCTKEKTLDYLKYQNSQGKKYKHLHLMKLMCKNGHTRVSTVIQI
jgi:hypothetical protein